MPDLSQQLIDAIRTPEQATGASPIGDYADITGYNAVTSALNWGKGGQNALGNESAAQAQYGREAAEVARRKQMLDLEEKIKAMKEQGVGDYVRTPKEDGGFDYKDKDGNPISAFEFARAKGVSVTDALQGSNNPNDLNFMNDYKYAQELMSSAQDPKALGAFLQTEAQKIMSNEAIDDKEKKKRISELQGMTQKDVMTRLYKAYPQIFPNGGYNTPTGTNVFPGGNQALNANEEQEPVQNILKQYQDEIRKQWLKKQNPFMRAAEWITPGDTWNP